MRLTGGARPRMEAGEMDQEVKWGREGDPVKEVRGRARTKCLLKMNVRTLD